MTLDIIIGTVLYFILLGVWIYHEVKNAPVLDDEWEDDPDVIDFLEQTDKPGPWDEKDDKPFTVGGLTNDKKGDFMKFQKKQQNN